MIKTVKGNIFGGYAATAWTSYGGYRGGFDHFIFSLVQPSNVGMVRIPLTALSYALYDHPSAGPIFDWDVATMCDACGGAQVPWRTYSYSYRSTYTPLYQYSFLDGATSSEANSITPEELEVYYAISIEDY